MNIIIVGMPCSGKSTLGKILSKKIGYRLIDTDSVIENNENMIIEEIFKKKGEEYFRFKEKELVDEFINFNNTIIVCGGGLPIYNNNMKKLNEIGITVFLDVKLNEIYRRAILLDDRPLLNNNLKETLENMYKRRIEIYRKAHIIIEGNGNAVDVILATLESSGYNI